jgi:hypothetical protein
VADKSTRKPTRPARKRQWQRPRVKTGQLFESNSLACNKSPSDPREECQMGPFQQS